MGLRKNISVKRAKQIVNWEIGHVKQNSDDASPKVVEQVQNSMKVIWFDLNAYEHHQSDLIKL